MNFNELGVELNRAPQPCPSCRDWLDSGRALSLFKTASCLDLHAAAPPWSTLASAEQSFGIVHKLWALYSSVLTLHLCAVFS